jgi:hypothetical protein
MKASLALRGLYLIIFAFTVCNYEFNLGYNHQLAVVLNAMLIYLGVLNCFLIYSTVTIFRTPVHEYRKTATRVHVIKHDPAILLLFKVISLVIIAPTICYISADALFIWLPLYIAYCAITFGINDYNIEVLS